MSLETVTEKLRVRLPEFGALDARVKFALEDGGVILIDATRSPPVLSRENDEDAACTIRVSSDRLEQLLDGELSPTLAYTLGQLKVEGSLGIAMKLAGMLEG